MAGKLRGQREIHDALDAALADARRNALIQAGAIVLMTPAILLAFAAVIVYGTLSEVERHPLSYGLADHPFLAGANGFFVFAVVPMLLAARRRGGSPGGAAIAVAGLAALLGLSYGTSLYAQPAIFFPLYGALAFATAVAVGAGYEPRDNYYLGWSPRGGSDSSLREDPLGWRHRRDAREMELGLASGLSGFLAGALGDLFGSAWLFRHLDVEELADAAQALHALGAGEAAHAARFLGGREPASAARVIRALAKLGLVRPGESGLVLTIPGERLVGTCEYL
jgi:hypothetical protein